MAAKFKHNSEVVYEYVEDLDPNLVRLLLLNCYRMTHDAPAAMTSDIKTDAV